MGKEFNIMIHGAGKMGTATYKAIMQQEDMEVLGAYDTDLEKLRKPEFSSLQLFCPATDPVTGSLENAIYNFEALLGEDTAVIVDFTSEEGCKKLFSQFECMTFSPDPPFIVIGTTPLSEPTERYISTVAQGNNIVAVRAPNFSVNVNRFLYDMENIAEPSPDDYISIHEVHRQEKSSTSGTAKEIAKILCQRFNRDGYITFFPSPQVFASTGAEIKTDLTNLMSEKVTNAALAQLYKKGLSNRLKDPNWIKISAERFADEPGMHVVRIGNESSYREYRIRATREDYAEGVVRSIRALPGLAEKGAGMYSFKKDVLGL